MRQINIFRNRCEVVGKCNIPPFFVTPVLKSLGIAREKEWPFARNIDIPRIGVYDPVRNRLCFLGIF